MTYDQVIAEIKDYQDKYYPIIKKTSRNSVKFFRRAYERWAIEEILIRLYEEELNYRYNFKGRYIFDPLDVIDDFILEMSYYIRTAPDPYLFEIAEGVAYEVGRLFV